MPCTTIKTSFRPVPLQWMHAYTAPPPRGLQLLDLLSKDGRALNPRLDSKAIMVEEARCAVRPWGVGLAALVLGAVPVPAACQEQSSHDNGIAACMQSHRTLRQRVSVLPQWVPSDHGSWRAPVRACRAMVQRQQRSLDPFMSFGSGGGLDGGDALSLWDNRSLASMMEGDLNMQRKVRFVHGVYKHVMSGQAGAWRATSTCSARWFLARGTELALRRVQCAVWDQPEERGERQHDSSHGLGPCCCCCPAAVGLSRLSLSGPLRMALCALKLCALAPGDPTPDAGERTRPTTVRR